MKRWIIFAVMFLMVPYARAAGERQTSSDFTGVGVSSDVIVSTFQFTAVISTQTGQFYHRRWAILIDNYIGNVNNFTLRITTEPLRPSTTGQGFRVQPNDPPWILSISGEMYLWAVTTGTVTGEKIYAQELK